MKCFVCGKEFSNGKLPCGLPTGAGFCTHEGKIIDICTGCIMGGAEYLELFRIDGKGVIKNESI